MTDKEAFINVVERLITPLETTDDPELEQAMKYFDKFKTEKAAPAEITENGKKILTYMQENWENYNNIFSAKTIGEGIFASSRSVSGAMRKLISEGFVDKVGVSPSCSYAITDKGKEKNLTE